MGAILETNAIFLSIADGKISRRVKSPTETSVQRTTKEGKVVNEEIYKGWSGRITDVKTKDHDQYGKFWMVTLADENGEAILQMNYSSGYASAFLKTLPNVDFTQDVNIVPNMKIEGDKKKTTLFITQNGTPLKHFWNKENPGELPQMVQKKVKGKLTWDDSDMMEYLERYVTEKVLPKLKNTKASAPAPVAAGEDEEPADDLPF
jgi:hypothetical protein